MKKNTVKLNEANLKKIVAESVRRVLREYSVPDSRDMKNNGAIPFIIQELKLFREYCEKRQSLYDKAHQYLDLNDFGNDEFEEHYYTLYNNLYENLEAKLDEIWNTILEPTENEIEADVQDWGERRFLEKNTYYGDMYNNKNQ